MVLLLVNLQGYIAVSHSVFTCFVWFSEGKILFSIKHFIIVIMMQ